VGEEPYRPWCQQSCPKTRPRYTKTRPPYTRKGCTALRILAVAAHPDDETLGAGGTLALHAARGDETFVMILADGVTSRHNEVELQEKCARRACDVLGVKDVVFAKLPDQRLDALPLLDVITPIENCIHTYQPDVVLTHFGQDANQDHRTVFRAVLVATRPVPGISVNRVLCWETASSTEWAPPFPGSVFSPNVFVDITPTLSRKMHAMAAYADTFVSEVREYPHPRSYRALVATARRHGATVGVRAAEPFMLVRDVATDGLRT
jgi:LmbE family N-acetylglucosaminyl deacetylase